MKIPFNKPYMTGKELFHIAQANFNGMLAGDGPFTKRCHQWLEQRTGSRKGLLTHSCTAALEMAAILLDLQPGDEVIMPSYTFVSTANAFVLRGATPVFVDIRADTQNIDERLIEAAITPRTKAIVPVHYAGVACEMDTIMDIAARHGLTVVEDAAQGLMSTYKGRALGSIGHLGCFSFHETKNIISGEGGALMINDEAMCARAEIIREKGTNRTQFFRGQVDKYTWCDIGSSFLPGELVAAFLWAQMEAADDITARRLSLWNRYMEAFLPLQQQSLVRLPVVPPDCCHNAHMFYLLLPDLGARTRFIAKMREQDIQAVFHYIPLHSSAFGTSVGRSVGDMHLTAEVSDRLVRLPIWVGLDEHMEQVIGTVTSSLKT